jgi:hypothetical protein
MSIGGRGAARSRPVRHSPVAVRPLHTPARRPQSMAAALVDGRDYDPSEIDILARRLMSGRLTGRLRAAAERRRQRNVSTLFEYEYRI